MRSIKRYHSANIDCTPGSCNHFWSWSAFGLLCESVSLSVATERGCCRVAKTFSIKILFYLVLHKVTGNHRQFLDSQRL